MYSSATAVVSVLCRLLFLMYMARKFSLLYMEQSLQHGQSAGIVGPQIVAMLKDIYKDTPAMAAYWSFIFGAGILTFGLLISFLSSNKPFEKK
jgi:hypothetical protein